MASVTDGGTTSLAEVLGVASALAQSEAWETPLLLFQVPSARC